MGKAIKYTDKELEQRVNEWIDTLTRKANRNYVPKKRKKNDTEKVWKTIKKLYHRQA